MKIRLILGIAVLLYAGLFYPRVNMPIIYPDSTSYISHSSSRGFVYPAFIDIFVPRSLQALPPITENFKILSWVQWLVFCISGLFLMLQLQKINVWGPLILIACFVAHHVLMKNAHLLGVVGGHNSFILSEGLG